ncbi:MAG: CDP-alcohol phosphatidyltransferase family protein [Candidatus Aminicenantales bacterium]
MAQEEKCSVWTLPNMLSLFRILLVPVFCWAIFQKKALEALLVFLLAGLTDVLDGWTARIWHQQTKIGTILDPAGDKLLMAASFIILSFPSLSAPNHIPLWLTVVVFSRDLLIVTGAFVAFLTLGQKSFTPSLLGKISTVCQVGTIFLVLLLNFYRVSSPLMMGVYYLTLLTTVASGVHYFKYGIHRLRIH